MNRIIVIAVVSLMLLLPPHRPQCCAQQTIADDEALKLEVSENIEVLRAVEWGRTEAEPWAQAIKKLVDIGPPAVDPICKALRETEVDFEMRAYGFALRAIGDPRAVQTLIESIPKTLQPSSSDYGLTVDDEHLMAFMRKHDVDELDYDKSFSFGRPIREITHAINKLTDHKMNDNEIVSIFLEGGPLQIYLRRKLYYDHTVKWREWWLENYESRGVEMDYVEIELAKFEHERPETINEFTNPNAVATDRRGGWILEGFNSAKEICFYDLDTGRCCKLPAELGDNPTEEKVSKWARSEGFDLMGVAISVAGKEKQEFVLKPLGMKAWQNQASRYVEIDEQIGQKDIEMGTPAKEYLAFYEEGSNICDPDKAVTFLFQTKEGTCGALQIVCQVTELLTKEDYGKPSRGTPENRGFTLGVKFDMKLFASP